MTKISTPIAVCSRSFSKHPELRKILLDKYDNVTFNDAGESLSGESLVNFLRGKEKAITALEKIDESILKDLPDLKVIGKYGVGLDMLDFEALEKHGVQLGWTPGVNKRSVAELVISFSINLLRGINFTGHQLRNKEWKQYKGRQLSSITFGIIGLGNVGKELATLLKGFGTKVIYHDIETYADFEKENGASKVALDELLATSDIVSLHVPKNDSTVNLVSKKELEMMKNSSFIINTSRGRILDEAALQEALEKETILGAALDVFEEEPCTEEKFVNSPKIITTPHIGGSSEEAILSMGRAAIEGLEKHTSPLNFSKYK